MVVNSVSTKHSISNSKWKRPQSLLLSLSIHNLYSLSPIATIQIFLTLSLNFDKSMFSCRGFCWEVLFFDCLILRKSHLLQLQSGRTAQGILTCSVTLSCQWKSLPIFSLHSLYPAPPGNRTSNPKRMHRWKRQIPHMTQNDCENVKLACTPQFFDLEAWCYQCSNFKLSA